MTTYSLILIPLAAGASTAVINGYATEDEATDAGDAAIVNPIWDDYTVIPGPPADIPLSVYQPSGRGRSGGIGGGGGGGGGVIP